MTDTILWLDATTNKNDLPNPETLDINFDWQVAMAHDNEKSYDDRYGRKFFWVCENGEWSDDSLEFNFGIPSDLNKNTLLPIDETFLHDAIHKWGKDSQIMIAMEECAELLTSLAQTFRASKDPNVITEIADVLITVSQLRLIFGKEEVDIEIERKIERTKRKLYG